MKHQSGAEGMWGIGKDSSKGRGGHKSDGGVI